MSLLLPLTLAAIVSTDRLGYECIPEEKLEVAFSLEGKGTRLPRTCIADPCNETFSEVTLATYVGYRDDAIYGDYRRRMTMICDAPGLWEEKGVTERELLWAVFDGGSGEIRSPEVPMAHSPVPAPALLLASAAAGLFALRRRRR